MPKTNLALRPIEWREQQELILIRGIPYSGKSTLAQRICERHAPNAHWWEADMFFETDKGYIYNKELISQAHQWCKNRTYQSLKNGSNPVIVANTFTQMWQMVPYFNMCREFGCKLRIIELHTQYNPNHHNVPAEAIARFIRNWEPIDTTRLAGIDFYILTVNPGDHYVP
jgi:predicted kinase